MIVMKLEAPYNFIPLPSPDSVFYPDWAEHISIDKPIEDGISGVIDVRFIAQSPVFVRNGLSKLSVTTEACRDIDPNDYNRFNHICIDGERRYFIPGSTVKGMLRSTVEIISNGKFSQVENQSFGKRDMGDRNYMSAMRDASCGWLYIDDDGVWTIEDHGKAQKVNTALIESVVRGIMVHIRDCKSLNSDENKTASAKYRLLMEGRKFGDVDFYKKIFDDKLKVRYSIETRTSYKNGRKITYNVVPSINTSSDNLEGILILTGQQGCYDPMKNRGKHHEFIFPAKKVGTYTVSAKVIDAFRTIHVNSVDWTGLWAEQLMNRRQRIPVFFCKDAKGEVTSMGLASMYKYPYLHSVHDVIPKEFLCDRPDLAECMFGYSYEGEDSLVALKGRVHVGHFFVSSGRSEEKVHKLILGSPHPSYYPLYVNDGKSWDEAVEVNGRKFYPIRKDDAIEPLPSEAKVVNAGKLVGSAVALCPLAPGTEFKGKIRFFNLKPFELGALVSALTLFGDNNRYHSIGMGKPLGYGKIAVAVEHICYRSWNEPDKQIDSTVQDCVGLFTTGISGYDYTAWAGSEVNKQFTAMTSENDKVDSYMVMDTSPDKDEFRLLKKSKGLPRFTEKDLAPGKYSAEVVSVKSNKFKGTISYCLAVTVPGHDSITVMSKVFELKGQVYNVGSEVRVKVEYNKDGRLWVTDIR